MGTVLTSPPAPSKMYWWSALATSKRLWHISYQVTSNLLGAYRSFGVFVYSGLADGVGGIGNGSDWFGCYALMTRGYEESYQNTINKTKILNDTAVEYINGIEVIKAFGRRKAPTINLWRRRKRAQAAMWSGCGGAISISALPCLSSGYHDRSASHRRSAIPSWDAGRRYFHSGHSFFSVGLIAPLITVMSYGDDLAKAEYHHR